MYLYIQVDYSNGYYYKIYMDLKIFPTTKQERDILKFKGKSVFNNYYLTNNID